MFLLTLTRTHTSHPGADDISGNGSVLHRTWNSTAGCAEKQSMKRSHLFALCKGNRKKSTHGHGGPCDGNSWPHSGPFLCPRAERVCAGQGCPWAELGRWGMVRAECAAQSQVLCLNTVDACLPASVFTTSSPLPLVKFPLLPGKPCGDARGL